MLKILKRKARTLIFYKTKIGEVYTKSYDTHHHLKYSFKEKSIEKDRIHLKYYLTKYYHIVEKGLALPSPRLGFAQPKILDIIEKTKVYEQQSGSDELVLNIRKTLSEYLSYHNSKNFELPEELNTALVEFLYEYNGEGLGGLKYINKTVSTPLSLNEFDEFSKSRVSVRDFSNETVDNNILYSAVETAKSAPSVCNRQGWKVHHYNNKKDIKEILAYQNGNNGFTDTIDKLLIVTGDAKAFTSYESNQIFIDGGLLSMNLLLAIHAAGLGACALNTCYPPFLEKQVKKVAAISDSERLIMMIAVGCLKDSYGVAYSARNATKNIFIAH